MRSRELKVQCPQDISVATFDDLSLDKSSHSHLTAVVQPSYDMGARASTLLMDRIEGRLTGDPIVVRVVPTLVIRESTRRYQPIDNYRCRRPREKASAGALAISASQARLAKEVSGSADGVRSDTRKPQTQYRL